MTAAWWDKLKIVEEFRELMEILKAGPNKEDLLQTQELMRWLFAGMVFLGCSILVWCFKR